MQQPSLTNQRVSALCLLFLAHCVIGDISEDETDPTQEASDSREQDAREEGTGTSCNQPQSLFSMVITERSGTCVDSLETIWRFDDILRPEDGCENRSRFDTQDCFLEIDIDCEEGDDFAVQRGRFNHVQGTGNFAGSLSVAASVDGDSCQGTYDVELTPLGQS